MTLLPVITGDLPSPDKFWACAGSGHPIEGPLPIAALLERHRQGQTAEGLMLQRDGSKDAAWEPAAPLFARWQAEEDERERMESERYLAQAAAEARRESRAEPTGGPVWSIAAWLCGVAASVLVIVAIAYDVTLPAWVADGETPYGTPRTKEVQVVNAVRLETRTLMFQGAFTCIIACAICAAAQGRSNK